MAAAVALGCGAVFAQNPLMQKYYGTPYEIPPFEKITLENYREGMLKGMEQEDKEIQAIIDCKDEPTFDNVIEPYTHSGALLDKAYVWSTINGTNSTPELQAFAREMSPLTSAHNSARTMNKALFEKVKYVYDHQDKYNLDKEQKRILEKTYQSFVNGGALLSDAQQKEQYK